MVALLHPDAQPLASGHRPGLRLVVDNTADNSEDHSGHRPGARGAGLLPALDRSVAVAVLAVAFVVFGSLFLLRAVQGSPTAVSPDAGVSVAGSEGSGPAVAGPGDEIIVAKPGDSMWSIAVLITPDSDPRPAVTALIEANGTDSVRIGQQIVIPEQLLD